MSGSTLHQLLDWLRLPLVLLCWAGVMRMGMSYSKRSRTTRTGLSASRPGTNGKATILPKNEELERIFGYPGAGYVRAERIQLAQNRKTDYPA
jgi:hypothetical protein